MLRLCLSQWKIQNSMRKKVKIFINPLIDNYKNNKNKNIREYGTEKLYNSRSFIDEKKIFHSPHGDVDLLDGSYLHEIIWRDVDKWWNKTAVICSMTGRSYTYGQLRRLSGRFATSLRKLNVKPGDTVAIVLPNIPEYPIVSMGASEAGIKLTLINPSYTAREINMQLENSETTLVVTVPSKYPVVAQSIIGVKSIRLPVVVIDDLSGPTPSGTIKFNELVADSVVEFEKTDEKTEIDAANDTVILPYSSGTTGLPKGVELTHRNIVSNLAQFSHKSVSVLEQATENYQDVTVFFLPLYHIYGFAVFYHSLSNGGKIITMPTFTSNDFLKILEENRLSIIFVAPPVLQLMANDERFKKQHMSGLRRMMSAAAPAGEEVVAKLRARLGESFLFFQGYGLTEASPLITVGIDSPVGSVGKIFPNTKIRIVKKNNEDDDNDDGTGENLSVNEIGEIQVSGPQVMKGYFKNSQATSETMDGKWLKTGDLGSIDNDGNLTINGRLKELIKVKGSQVSPPELEDILHSHDKVADVAVVGVPHERFGEIPKAFVVAKQGVQINEDEIKKFVAEKVADYKQLGHVEFIDQIPKNQAGKILRKNLQKM
ncbi:hypothetical protein HCN44_002234 [Aphidius gifuensis]|uniref:Uncharacterized protein n=1 Tax=Aphidius gifuensis TaxID=684658 RepID=A0A835CWP6_APHGI|nr:4-coumarate--CoA ligase 1-like [Aphidius gifuensis]KAF7996588.1 hypothetical protein HCN44_002234 [Aphidius gifuensis]